MKRHKLAELKKKKNSLTYSMFLTLGAGWLLPLLIITFILIYVVTGILNNQLRKTIVESMENAVEICDMKLEEIWNSSKKATYNNTIADSYNEYCEGLDSLKLYNDVTNYLNQEYRYDASMLSTMVFFMGDLSTVYYSYNTYSNKNQGNDGFQRVNYFKFFTMDYVLEASKDLDTGVELVWHNNHLYMIRNLVNEMFEPFGMIVVELDPDFTFSSLKSVWGANDYQLYVEGEPVFISDNFDDSLLAGRKSNECSYFQKGRKYYATMSAPFGNQTVIYAVNISRESLISEMKMLRYILILMALFVVPLAFVIFYFFNRKVTIPINELVKGATEITSGNYGYETGVDSGSNEFTYLQQSFNSMSKELKYQFDTIYKEEIELRDANIMALQSQINPHFLNNTLEIINWEARMNGNESVSAMIEALGTMLSATMNRKKRKFVPLSEELSYVDAYLYIIGRRFGERFEVYKEINETLMDIEVPLLIIQPIVENAVEHGVEAHGCGMVAISITSDWDKMTIDVINDGVLSNEDKEKIDFLLNAESEMENERHISLGIRNVNRRIKIIYGDDCGLTITSNKNNETVSRIVVRMQHEPLEEKANI